jgi:hypothetical protein
MARRNSESGRQAVIWLATAIVVVIGAAATAVVIFAGTDQIEQPLIVWATSFSGLIFVLFCMNFRWDRPIGRLQLWLSAQDRNDPTDADRAARRQAQTREKFGSNAPPSVETVRDASDHGGAWVPRSSTSAQSRKRS